MKPRRVRLILDVETDVPLSILRSAGDYYKIMAMDEGDFAHKFEVLRAGAVVIEPWDVKEAKHASSR